MSDCSRVVFLFSGSVLLSWHGLFFVLQIVSPSVGVLLLREEILSTMGCFRRYIFLFGSKLYLVPAPWDAFAVASICFVGSKPSSVFCFGPRS